MNSNVNNFRIIMRLKMFEIIYDLQKYKEKIYEILLIISLI
jgi:hypothetical protein